MYSLTREPKFPLTARSAIWSLTLGVSNVTVLSAIAASKVFCLTISGGVGASPVLLGFPMIIVNVCCVDKLPPSVAVTVKV